MLVWHGSHGYPEIIQSSNHEIRLYSIHQSINHIDAVSLSKSHSCSHHFLRLGIGGNEELREYGEEKRREK